MPSRFRLPLSALALAARALASPVDAQVDVSNARLPLPVLFLHGMSGDASSWGEMTDLLTADAGLTEGPNLNYCLTSDGSIGTSTLEEVLPFTALPDGHADFFRINFECDGSGQCWSNSAANSDGIFSGQAAAAKQGLAVADAVAGGLCNRCDVR